MVSPSRVYLPLFTLSQMDLSMIKHIMMMLCAFIFTQVVYADTCPTINDLKNNQFHMWNAFHSDSGTALSDAELLKFIRIVSLFKFAELAKGSPEGSSHCYYNDVNGNYTFAYLAKKHLTVDVHSIYWQSENDIFRCYADTSSCVFVPKQ